MSYTERKWNQTSLSDIVPETVTTAVNSLGDATSPIITVLKAVQQVLNVAAGARGTETNAIEAVLASVRAVINSALELFTNTQVSATWIVPKAMADVKTVEEAMEALADSFNDDTDEDRPFSDGGFFVMINLVAISRDIDGVYDILSPVFSFLDIPLEKGKAIPDQFDGVYPPVNRKGQGVAPDWEAYKLSDLGLFGQLTRVLQTFKAKTLTGQSQASVLDETVSLVEAKITSFEEIITSVEEIIAKAEALANLPSGLFTLSLWGDSSTQDQSSQIRTATDDASFPFSEDQETDVCVVLSVHMQTSDAAGFEALKNIWRVASGAPVKKVESGNAASAFIVEEP